MRFTDRLVYWVRIVCILVNKGTLFRFVLFLVFFWVCALVG